jgi:hypothetical protein
MATPDQPVYAIANGFMLGTRQVKLLEYQDLLASAPRRGRNRIIPLSDEILLYPRRGGEKVCQLGIQIDGKWTDTNTAAAGDPAENAHDLLVALSAEDGEGGLLGVGLASVAFEFHVWTMTYTGTAQILGVYEPNFGSPSICNAVLEVSVHPALLTVAP